MRRHSGAGRYLGPVALVVFFVAACGDDGAEAPQPGTSVKVNGVCVWDNVSQKAGPTRRCDLVDSVHEADFCKEHSDKATFYEDSSCADHGFAVKCDETWWDQSSADALPMKEDQLCGTTPALGPCKRAGEECSVHHCYAPGLSIPTDARPCKSTVECDYGYACIASYTNKSEMYCLILCSNQVPGGGGSGSEACKQCKKTCSGQGSWCQCDKECG